MRKINEISLLLVFYGAAKISSPISVQIYKATLREVFQITSLIPKLPSWHLPFLPPSIHSLPSSSKVLSTPLILILSFLPCFLWIILAIFFPPFCLLVRSYISHFYCFISLLLLTMNTLWKKLQNNALPWFFFLEYLELSNGSSCIFSGDKSIPYLLRAWSEGDHWRHLRPWE